MPRPNVVPARDVSRYRGLFFVPFLSFRRSSRPSAAGQHSCAPTPGWPPPAGGGVQSPASPFYTHKYEAGKAPLRRSSKSVQRAQALDLCQLDDIPEAFPRVTSIRAATGEAVERSEQSEQSEQSGKAREGASGRMRSRRGKLRRRTPLAGDGCMRRRRPCRSPAKRPVRRSTGGMPRADAEGGSEGRTDGERAEALGVRRGAPQGAKGRGAAVGGMGAQAGVRPLRPVRSPGGPEGSERSERPERSDERRRFPRTVKGPVTSLSVTGPSLQPAREAGPTTSLLS